MGVKIATQYTCHMYTQSLENMSLKNISPYWYSFNRLCILRDLYDSNKFVKNMVLLTLSKQCSSKIQ